MADVSVYDSLTIEDTAAKYEVGAALGTFALQTMNNEVIADDDHVPYFVNANIGGSVGAHTIRAAPGSGKYIIVESLTIVSSDKNVVRIGYGTQCGWIENTYFGPFAFNTEATAAGYKVGTQYRLELKRPIRLPVNKALTADVDATGRTTVTAEIIEN